MIGNVQVDLFNQVFKSRDYMFMRRSNDDDTDSHLPRPHLHFPHSYGEYKIIIRLLFCNARDDRQESARLPYS